MTLKTFNVEEKTYSKFSQFCRNRGISMSKQINMFMESVVEEDPEAKKEYLQKLEEIRKGKFIEIKDFSERYAL